MSNEEVEMMYRGAPIDSRGNFDYVAFTKVLKHGTKDE
jgi:Ca2+-binding EF-hand superfamily protein